MEELLRLLENDARLTPAELAAMLGEDVERVREKIEAAERDNVILGYKTLIDWDKTERENVTALIEVKVTPQRDVGFDKIAERIYRFPEVKSVYLMSGGFDFALIIEGRTMQEVAMFVAQRLAPLEHVTSTATHFVLKKYKDNGVAFEKPSQDERGKIVL